MSNEIDNEIVSLQFNNARFEKNIAQSIESIQDLQESIYGLGSASDALDELGDTTFGRKGLDL